MKTFGYTAAALFLGSLCSAKGCDITDLEGVFLLEYDFFDSSAGVAFADSSAGLTFEPVDNTAGDQAQIMKVNYCFNIGKGDNINPMIAVQTGFSNSGIIPLKITKYESDVRLRDIYNEYAINCEYKCGDETLKCGLAAYFEGNGFTAEVAKKNDTDLNQNGCPA